ncbi:sigma-70 family RNA polymerase sigma factor [Mariniblastus sp.]|nr:sigma-70 family RNA polymerase sigma factor [Mariniblastus sp.]
MPDNESPRQAQPEEWLDQHGDALFKFARLRLGNIHLAEDMVQETLIKGMRGFEKFRGEASVRTWLFQILRNEISSYFRSAKRSASKEVSASDSFLESDLLHPLVSTPKFQSIVEKEEFWVVIQTCFERLPDHLLDSFLLRLANPSEKVDILCNHLGVNASNFSVRLFRARLMLRKCLESNWLNDSDKQ